MSHVLPYLLLLGLGFGLSLAPSFSTGTLGLKPSDAGVGSATLNTSQQVGGSIGTALLNTLAAGAATAYLVGRAITPASLQAAAVHSYTTAFLYSSVIFVLAAVIAGLVLPRGNMRALSGSVPDGTGGTGTDSRPSAGVITSGTTRRPVDLPTPASPAADTRRRGDYRLRETTGPGQPDRRATLAPDESRTPTLVRCPAGGPARCWPPPGPSPGQADDRRDHRQAGRTRSSSSAITCRRGSTTSHPGSDVPDACATRHRGPKCTRSRGGGSGNAFWAQLTHGPSLATACIIPTSGRRARGSDTARSSYSQIATRGHPRPPTGPPAGHHAGVGPARAKCGRRHGRVADSP